VELHRPDVTSTRSLVTVSKFDLASRCVRVVTVRISYSESPCSRSCRAASTAFFPCSSRVEDRVCCDSDETTQIRH